MSEPREHLEASAHRQRWWVLLGVGASLLAVNLDLTVVNLALPTVGKVFQIGLTDLQWITSTTSVTFAATIATAGRGADHFGHRKTYLGAMFVFLLGSLLAGLANGLPMLLTGRVLQGLGSAGIFITAFTLTNLHFPANRQGFAIGLLMLFTGAAMALGPTAGAWLVEFGGWRWAFLLNVPVCLGSAVVVTLACRNDPGNPDAPIHYASAFFLALAFFLLLLACNESLRWGIGSWQFNVALAGGAAALTGTLRWQSRLQKPLLDLSLYRLPQYRSVTVIRLPFQLTIAGFFFAMPLYLQNVKALSPGTSGLVLLSMTAVVAVSSPIAGKLCDQIGPSKLIVTAHLFGACGYGLLALMAHEPQTWQFAAVLTLLGMQVGIMLSATNRAAIGGLPPDRTGVGFGMFLAVTFLVYSVGIAASGHLLTDAGVAELYRLAAFHGITDEMLAAPEMVQVVSGSRPITVLSGTAPGRHGLLESIVGAAALYAFRALLWTFAGLCLAGLPVWLALHRSAGRRQRKTSSG